MATHTVSEAVHRLGRFLLLREKDALTDAQLLESFAQDRDGVALEVIVRRHGPMVWGVCRRILMHHDAEDAFQATFLVLTRKATSLNAPCLVANWLYGVARRTALRARAAAARRKERERQVTRMPEPAAAENDGDDLLDKELSLLPDHYRAVIVVCDLEGKTRKEAARQLGLPEGTVASRLTRARAMLAKRLARHGLGVSALVPTSVLSATIKAVTSVAAGQGAAGLVSAGAAALAKGVVRDMGCTKLKFVLAVVLAVAFLGVGAGPPVRQGGAAEKFPKSEAAQNQDEFTKTLVELDERWWKADVEGSRELAADDLITVSGLGRYDKASLLEASRNRHPVNWTRRDVEVSRVSKDVGIITYVYDCKIVLADGTPLESRHDRRFSMVWVRRKGKWVAVFAQETILPGGE